MVQVKVGDIVKSYDFTGLDSCYMIGKVVSVSKQFGDFRAKFVKRVFDNKVDTKCSADFFSAPLQGTMFTDDPASPRIEVMASLVDSNSNL